MDEVYPNNSLVEFVSLIPIPIGYDQTSSTYLSALYPALTTQ